MSAKLSRRDFFKFLKYAAATTFASLAGAYYGLEVEPQWLEIAQVEIPLGRLPKAFDGYRILQVSDIHIGGWMNRERLETVVEVILAQQPDLVLATGDFVIGHAWSRELDLAAEDFIEVMRPLTQTLPVIGVMGNHDHWTDAARTRDMLVRANILELQNDARVVKRDGDELYIAGLDDVYARRHDLEGLLTKLPADAHVILMAHEPDFADTTAPTGKFMLQLSGHSHGGQVVLPFIGAPVLPRWGRKYPAGLYRIADMWLYTNRGVGMTDPFIRFNCRPEITVFTLNGPE